MWYRKGSVYDITKIIICFRFWGRKIQYHKTTKGKFETEYRVYIFFNTTNQPT